MYREIPFSIFNSILENIPGKNICRKRGIVPITKTYICRLSQAHQYFLQQRIAAALISISHTSLEIFYSINNNSHVRY